MSIKIYKSRAGFDAKDLKELDISFTDFSEAEKYVTDKILVMEKNKYVTFKLKNIGALKNIREYMFLDDNDYQLYSYRIIER